MEEAKRRAERGELDMDHQDKRRTLRSVLQLQRKLGLAKAAGTDSMRIDGLEDGFQGESNKTSLSKRNALVYPRGWLCHHGTEE